MSSNIFENACKRFNLLTLFICSCCILPMSYSTLNTSEEIRIWCAKISLLIIYILCIISIIRKKIFVSSINKIFNSFTFLCVIEMLVACLQYLQIIPSFHPLFRITGTFWNPSILAMMLALCFSISIYKIIKYKNTHSSLWYIIAIVALICLFVTESRTCILAVFFATFLIAYLEKRAAIALISRPKAICITVILSVILIYILYCCKKDSADGRLLIWQVSLKLIEQKLWFGWGKYGFSSSYMPIQAEFLSKYNCHFYTYLADNVSHPFNEFILFCIKYGVIGLFSLFALILTLLVCVIKSKCLHKNIYITLIIEIVIFSMFSYPYSVPLIWIIISFITCHIVSIYCMSSHKLRI